MGNAQIATLAIGVVSFSIGGNLIWSIIAIIIGLIIDDLHGGPLRRRARSSARR
jgi:purine-cytosine permease-like protein